MTDAMSDDEEMREGLDELFEKVNADLSHTIEELKQQALTHKQMHIDLLALQIHLPGLINEIEKKMPAKTVATARLIAKQIEPVLVIIDPTKVNG